MNRTIHQFDDGPIKVKVQDWWRSKNAKGIDVEVYKNGKFRFNASATFGPNTGYYNKQSALAAARAYIMKVFAGKVSLEKADWEKNPKTPFQEGDIVNINYGLYKNKRGKIKELSISKGFAIIAVPIGKTRKIEKVIVDIEDLTLMN